MFDLNGKCMGVYKKGKDIFIVNDVGDSYISYVDYVIVVLDELENLKY